MADTETPTRTTAAARGRKNTTVLLTALGGAMLMVGASFAAVPLYDLFCRITGFGGTTQVAAGTTGEVLDRTVRVRFMADADPTLPWQFEAEQREVETRIGEPQLVFYTARNTSDEPVTGMAVYNVTPHKVGPYFAKMQCFCFEEQTIMPGEEVAFPVYFFVDPAMDGERTLDDVAAITLSYTFYQRESDALDDAVDEYYRTVEQAAVLSVAAPGNDT